ncbi:arylsulfatase A-like enzyme [Wenyingzhuangia heitensis]|uniref:Arylsulfatase A-like enzyme n=1 Tax=Wenyingzhuangia heitensis TaxID=1487859 RepID=A0ABX0UDJ5_9FLAO|nr:sulfatase-like hydrolase/transferase [Wenyingzhuangia heitensis]NIJ45910.1 arylsulfatase A-like enzyme [Wenyingzhuangia heitensis]
MKAKVLLASLFFFMILPSKLLAQKNKRPNIIFILTDDQSYGMMGYTGNKIIQTPNLDILAKKSVFFTNAHVSSAICTPSRVSILLGQFERKHSVNFNSATSVSKEAWSESYPVLMRNAGYYTAYIGKNHSPIGKNGYESGLVEKSYDYWYASHGGVYFYPKEKRAIYKDAIANTQVEILEEGVNQFLDPNARRLKGAISFLDSRPKDKPFLLNLMFNIPHGATTSTMKQRPEDDEIYRSLYRDVEIPLPKNYIAKADIKTPKLPAEIHHTKDRQTGYDYVDVPETLRERYIRQLQCITGIDRLVGQLRKKLKKLKLDKNTIIIFTSDHGLFMGEYGLGGKAFCYEKTTHVPLFIYNPMQRKGITSDALVQTIDIAPTILSLGGVKISSAMQGKDLSGFVNDKPFKVRDYLYTENLWSTTFGNPRCESVQTKEWKYIRYYQNNNVSAIEKAKLARQFNISQRIMLYEVHPSQFAVYRSFVEGPIYGEKPVYEELYHLTEDPNETQNLIDNAEYKNVLKELKSAWKIEIKNARGTEKPKVDIYTNMNSNV